MKLTGTFISETGNSIYKYGDKIFSTTNYGKSLSEEVAINLEIIALNRQRDILEKRLKEIQKNKK
jgi:hypothetical protein